MTVKAVDDEDMNIVGTTNTLKAAQEEKWTHLDYIDESVFPPYKYDTAPSVICTKTYHISPTKPGPHIRSCSSKTPKTFQNLNPA